MNALSGSSKSFFEQNRVVTAAASVVGVLAITTLVIGILAQTNVLFSLYPIRMPLVACSAAVLMLDTLCLLGMVANGESKIEADTVFTSTRLGLQQGPGFPLVGREQRQSVIDAGRARLEADWESGGEVYAAYCRGTVLYSYDCNSQTDVFFPEGTILQTPVKMDYDQNFEPMESRKYFYMHSTAAPKPSQFQDEPSYLDAMEEGYYQLLCMQYASGAEHLLTNYWGMGAFIRGYIASSYPDRRNAFDFRLRIARRLAHAFQRVAQENLDKTIRFYIGGPTGASFEPKFAQEPLDNYNAFVCAFEELPDHLCAQVVMCPETDIFVLGQQISDGLSVRPGQLAPVSAINASCSGLIGNKWFKGRRHNGTFNAEFAIEENVFRRSPISAWIAARLNGGLFQTRPPQPLREHFSDIDASTE